MRKTPPLFVLRGSAKGILMPMKIIDYVVRRGDGIWTVWRRSYDPALVWLQTHEISRHAFQEDALIEMRERNLTKALAS